MPARLSAAKRPASTASAHPQTAAAVPALSTVLTRSIGRRSRLRPIAMRPALESGATAAAWLYVYSVMWLGIYAILGVLIFGWKPVIITGGSMDPSISRGDLVLVGKLKETAGPGTVLTFRSPAGPQLVTHRVREALPEGYRTRGDANAVDDSDPVPQTSVVGSGRLLVPLIGRPLVWLHTGRYLVLFTWLLASLAAVLLVSRRVEERPDPLTPGTGTSRAGAAGRAPAREATPRRLTGRGRLRDRHA